MGEFFDDAKKDNQTDKMKEKFLNLKAENLSMFN
jgi:hypothetical protein